MEAVVEIDNVTVRTPEKKALIRDITWRVLPGERWVVLGPNGAGKTTLLSVVGAERHPSSGSARALGETFGWHVGLARKPHRAKAFYSAIALATLIGVVLNFTNIDPIKALFWSAVINGIVAVPVMVMMMHLASHRAAMGAFKLHMGLKVMGWLETLTMAAAAVGLFVTWGH